MVDTEHRAVMALNIEGPGGAWGLCTATVFHVEKGSALLLTAAHCVVRRDGNDEILTPPVLLSTQVLRVTASNNIYADDLLQRHYPVAEARVPPMYSGILGSPDDIAIIRIVGAPSELAQLPVMQLDAEPAAVGEAVTLVGFGRTEHETTGVKRVVSQSVAWRNDEFMGWEQSNGSGICHGDSGGPVLLSRQAHEVIAGVNSLGKGTDAQHCNANGTSLQITPHLDFIRRAIEEIPDTLDCDSCIAAEQALGNTCGPPVSCDGDCKSLLGCVGNCDDTACADDCQHSDASAYKSYELSRAGSIECAVDRCAATCQPAAIGSSPQSDGENNSKGCSYSGNQPGVAWWIAVVVFLGAVARRRARRIDDRQATPGSGLCVGNKYGIENGRCARSD